MENNDSILIPESDLNFLTEKGYNYSVHKWEGGINVIIHDFAFSNKYTPEVADLLIQLPAGYPNAALDMFWSFPAIKLIGGSSPQNCEHYQIFHDKNWQRWSRHNQAPWRVGIDNLQSFITAVKKELSKGI